MSDENFINSSEYGNTTIFFESVSSITARSTENDVIFLHSCLVLLVRAGLVLVQLASIPTHDVFVIIYQNIVDIALSIASFGSIGYVIAFGDDVKGIFGFKKLFAFANPIDIHNAVIGTLASLISMGIVTTILCGRISTWGYFLLIITLSGFIQPLVIHWVWHSEGWLYLKEVFATEVSFRDHSGGLIIHVFGGTVSLIGALFFGRRLMLLSTISELSIGVESPGSSFVGYVFIIMGLIGFSLTSFNYGRKHAERYSSGILVINNLAALSGGILIIFFIHIVCKKPINYWNALRCIQGGIAGIVTVAPGVNMYAPEVSFAAAAFSATIFYFISAVIQQRTSIEDYCNVISLHLVCGIIGLAFLPLIGNSEYFTSATIKFRIIHSLWQIMCTFTIIFFLIILSANLFFLLLICKNLRNRSEEADHERGVIAVQNQKNGKTFLDRLFKNAPSLSYLEPGPSNRNQSKVEAKETSPTKQKDSLNNSNIFERSSSTKTLRYVYAITNIGTCDEVKKNNLEDDKDCSSTHKQLKLNSSRGVRYYLHRAHKSLDLLFSKGSTSNNNLNSC